MTAGVLASAVPLFPLQTVLFPGGLLSMKVFEARYLDVMTACLRERRAFGVVALRTADAGSGAGGGPPEMQPTAVLADLIDADSTVAGILQVRCRGTFRLPTSARQQDSSGVWWADGAVMPDDPAVAPTASVLATVKGLANAIATLKRQGSEPFLPPYRFDQAGWVANRWCEILPISVTAKQKLMELDDPTVRLQLVDEYLRGKGVV